MHLRAASRHQLARGRQSPARRQDVIDEEDGVARLEAVGVNVKLGGAVFEIVLLLVRPVGELPRFAERHERLVEGDG